MLPRLHPPHVHVFLLFSCRVGVALGSAHEEERRRQAYTRYLVESHMRFLDVRLQVRAVQTSVDRYMYIMCIYNASCRRLRLHDTYLVVSGYTHHLGLRSLLCLFCSYTLSLGVMLVDWDALALHDVVFSVPLASMQLFCL